MIKNISIQKTPTTIYESSGSKTVISSIYICNTSSNTSELTIYAVGNKEVISDKTTIIKDLKLSPSASVIFNMEKMVLELGDKLIGKATSTGISLTVSAVIL